MDKTLTIEQDTELEERIVIARYNYCYGTNHEFIGSYNELSRKLKEYLGLTIISGSFTNFACRGAGTRIYVKDFIEECCDEEF